MKRAYARPPYGPAAKPYVLDYRVLDGGSVGLLTSRGNQTLRNSATVHPGQVAHTMKQSIERYLVWRLRTGRMHLP